MHFMIDYENVRAAGFYGKEYIDSDDYVTVFYSDAASSIEKGIWMTLCDSECSIEVCKLVKTGKNGLDFYIASRVAEVIADGYEDAIVIVSADKGFKAIQDYWRCRGKHSGRIVLSKDIVSGINSSNENSNRRKTIVENCKMISIGKEYNKYSEKCQCRMRVRELLTGTEYAELWLEISMIIIEASTRRDIYLSMLKRFGRKDGLQIYRFLMELMEEYAYAS